jgi:hypothetical protein
MQRQEASKTGRLRNDGFRNVEHEIRTFDHAAVEEAVSKGVERSSFM